MQQDLHYSEPELLNPCSNDSGAVPQHLSGLSFVQARDAEVYLHLQGPIGFISQEIGQKTELPAKLRHLGVL